MATGWYEDETGPKLPVTKTVGDAYAVFSGQIGSLLLVSWPWLLLAGAIASWLSLLAEPWQAAVLEAISANRRPPQQPSGLSAVSLLNSIIYLIALAVLAVSWHRFLLLDERMKTGGNLLTASVWRYIGVVMLTTLVAALPVLAVSILTGIFATPPPPPGAVYTSPVSGTGAVMGLLAIPAGIGAAMLMTRLTLLLPARAVGHNGQNFRSVWQATNGNTWRLLGGLFLCALPTFVVGQLAKLIGAALPIALLVVAELVLSMISVAFVSLSYLHFFPRPRDPGIDARANQH